MTDEADGKPAKNGRPTIFTPELAATITTRLMAGESLRSICRDPSMPARSSVHLWIATNESFSDQYAKACDVRADHLFDEMFDIADDLTGDTNRDRLRVDTRKWALSKMNPKRYGEKITNEVVGKDGGPIATTSIDSKKLSKAQLEALATIRLPTDSR